MSPYHFASICPCRGQSRLDGILVVHVHQRLNESRATPSGSSFAGGVVKARRVRSPCPRIGRSSR